MDIVTRREVEFSRVEKLCDRINDSVRQMNLGRDAEMAVDEILDDLLAQLEMTKDLCDVVDINS